MVCLFSWSRTSLPIGEFPRIGPRTIRTKGGLHDWAPGLILRGVAQFLMPAAIFDNILPIVPFPKIPYVFTNPWVTVVIAVVPS